MTEAQQRLLRIFHFSVPICAYNGRMAESLRVDKAEFEAVIKALLSTPPTPAKTIQGKPRRADAKKPGPKKKG